MKKRWIILPVVLLILAAAFILLDFRLINSQNRLNSNSSASRTGDPSAPWDFSPAVTGLYVEGKGPLAENIQARIKGLIQNQKPFGEITAINAPADRMDIPVLSAEIRPQKLFWTPFYAHSEYQLVVAYASNGDISFRNPSGAHYTDASFPSLQFMTTFTLQDTSIGVMSLPGYQSYLAEKMAGAVQETLQQQIKN